MTTAIKPACVRCHGFGRIYTSEGTADCSCSTPRETLPLADVGVTPQPPIWAANMLDLAAQMRANGTKIVRVKRARNAEYCVSQSGKVVGWECTFAKAVDLALSVKAGV